MEGGDGGGGVTKRMGGIYNYMYMCQHNKDNLINYLSSSHSERRCGTGIPASPAAFFTL